VSAWHAGVIAASMAAGDPCGVHGHRRAVGAQFAVSDEDKLRRDCRNASEQRDARRQIAAPRHGTAIAGFKPKSTVTRWMASLRPESFCRTP